MIVQCDKISLTQKDHEIDHEVDHEMDHEVDYHQSLWMS
jgi:hypothetical protein